MYMSGQESTSDVDEFSGSDFEEYEPGKFAVCVVIKGSD